MNVRHSGWVWMLAVVLCGPVHAGLFGNDPASDTNEQLTRLFDVGTPFTATVVVSVKGRVGKEKQAAEMQYAFLDGKLRTELDMVKTQAGQKRPEAMEQVAGLGMSRMITLYRPDKKATYVIYPGLGGYCEFPQTRAEAAADSAAKIQKTPLGQETIEGHACTKYRVVVTEAGGRSQEMTVWEATDLKNFPIQTVMKANGDTVTTLFRNIKFEKAPPGLFEVPSTLKRYENMQDMMMESLQQMLDMKGE